MPINRRITGGEIVNKVSVEGDATIPKAYNDPNYEHLTNKPAINGHELVGDQTSVELGIEIIKDDLTASRSVGGVTSGTSYETGTTLEQILRDILNPTDFPELTNPSVSIQSSIPTLQESGSENTATFTIIFNRGSINPAYGTSGYRSGPATTYTLNGISHSSDPHFSHVVSEQDYRFRGTVEYSEGEQPYDSEGNEYSAPLPAGSVSSLFTFEFVLAIWANTANITQITKLPLISKSAGQIIFDFPAQTVINAETFDIPANWTVTSVEVYNDLSSRYEDCSFEFSTADVTHPDASGSEIDYIRYRDNRGYAADTRRVRVKWST